MLAKQTNHMPSWTPIRDILVRSFWCYRYLQKTSVLDDKLNETTLPIFLAACQNAQAKLHLHQPFDARKIQELPKEWSTASATLFFREFISLLEKINAFEPPLVENEKPVLAAA